jgi:hypothetical protein
VEVHGGLSRPSRRALMWTVAMWTVTRCDVQRACALTGPCLPGRSGGAGR